jgi:hypothetical protein
MQVHSEAEFQVRKDRKDTVDWIIQQGDESALFVECKTKRLTWASKVGLADPGALQQDIQNLASAVYPSISHHRKPARVIRPNFANDARFWQSRVAPDAQNTQNVRSRKIEFRDRNQGSAGCPVVAAKIFLFLKIRSCALLAASRLDMRGVRVVTDVEAGCDGREWCG